ncbi:Conjugal transfer protein TrbL [Frankia sp. AiPs1]|uniref:type IV secretion system protein n=1 Tax=Frankia sp. AiPa1 TaxID=573492 RepID=UPI00202B359A|nr:type IV secretion system protein [Frankia sp. AiPa1]MCL9758662.1 type IV secretion system protein [Frankia sp. AiPa1]
MAAVCAAQTRSHDRSEVSRARGARSAHGPRGGPWGRGLWLVRAAALLLLLFVVASMLAPAAQAAPAPAAAPSAATPAPSRPTPDPAPGPSPTPPGGSSTSSPAAPTAPPSPAGSLPFAWDVPPTGTSGSGSGNSGGGTAQPTTPAQPPSVHTTPAAPDSDDGGGGGITGWITDAITGAINSFFRKLVTAALNPLLDLLGKTLLTTPTPSQLPAIGQMWTTSWTITVAAYGVLIMAGGITIMSIGTVQHRTTIKEIAPRIPLGFLAAGLSQFLAGKMIELANPLPAAILSGGVDPNSTSIQLRNIVLSALSPTPGNLGKSIFIIFLGLFLSGSIVVLLCTYIARVAITVILIGAAPLALAGHALPQTERIAFWWWRAFSGCLAIQVAQALVLLASFKTFFAPGGFTLLGPSPDGIVNMLAAITMIYFLVKIPFWLAPRMGGGRSSLVGRIVRGYVMGRAMGLLGGRAGARAGVARRGGRGRGVGRGGRRNRGSADPYEKVQADANGQLLLPLTRVPRVRRPATPRGAPRQAPRPGAPKGRPRHRQLTIPFDEAVGPGGRWLYRDRGQWVDRDDQLLLPFEVDQTDRPPATPPTRPSSSGAGRQGSGRPARNRGRQLELPFDPYKGIRPDRRGQYALPLEGLRRTPRPARPPAASPPSGRSTPVRGGRQGRQLELPFDPYQGLRPDRTGQYALPLEGLERAARPRPATPAAPPARPPTARPRPVPPRHQQLLLPDMPRRSRPPHPGK